MSNRSVRWPQARSCGCVSLDFVSALQIYYSGFNEIFFKLPSEIQRRIEAKIDDMGLRLNNYRHYRMVGHDRYRLRVGDYRIIYKFDTAKGVIHLLAVGHWREVYR